MYNFIFPDQVYKIYNIGIQRLIFIFNKSVNKTAKRIIYAIFLLQELSHSDVVTVLGTSNVLIVKVIHCLARLF